MTKTYTVPAVGQLISEVALTEWPIPAQDVLEGDPVARGAVVSRSEDSRIVRGVWSCSPGRFNWKYAADETVVVVEGRATVEYDSGEVVELEPGTVAFFGRDHSAVWTVREAILKGFHLDSPDPLDL